MAIGGYAFLHALEARAEAVSVRESWREASATILSVQGKTRTDYDSRQGKSVETGWSELTYEYEFEGRRYESNQYDVLVRHIVPPAASFVVGQSVTCFVNPEAPSRSVLNASMPDLTAFYVFSAMFIGIPSVILAAVWIRFFRPASD